MKKMFLKQMLLPILVIFFLFLTPVLAQNRTVGVSVGDWFEYKVFDRTPNSSEPTFYWWVNVTAIEGTNVTCISRVYDANGTLEGNGDGWKDVASGEGSGPYSTEFNHGIPIVAANLGVNDAWYTDYPSSHFSQTLTRTYLNETREMNCIEGPDPSEQHVYLDKRTGVMVEMYMETSTGHNTEELINSNVWIVPEYPSLIIPTFLIVISSLFVAVIKSKCRK